MKRLILAVLLAALVASGCSLPFAAEPTATPTRAPHKTATPKLKATKTPTPAIEVTEEGLIEPTPEDAQEPTPTPRKIVKKTPTPTPRAKGQKTWSNPDPAFSVQYPSKWMAMDYTYDPAINPGQFETRSFVAFGLDLPPTLPEATEFYCPVEILINSHDADQIRAGILYQPSATEEPMQIGHIIATRYTWYDEFVGITPVEVVFTLDGWTWQFICTPGEGTSIDEFDQLVLSLKM
jgi:hypothetical protein